MTDEAWSSTSSMSPGQNPATKKAKQIMDSLRFQREEFERKIMEPTRPEFYAAVSAFQRLGATDEQVKQFREGFTEIFWRLWQAYVI